MRRTRFILPALFCLLCASGVEGREVYDGIVNDWQIKAVKNESDNQFSVCMTTRAYANDILLGMNATYGGEITLIIGSQKFNFKTIETLPGSIRIDDRDPFNSLDIIGYRFTILFPLGKHKDEIINEMKTGKFISFDIGNQAYSLNLDGMAQTIQELQTCTIHFFGNTPGKPWPR